MRRGLYIFRHAAPCLALPPPCSPVRSCPASRASTPAPTYLHASYSGAASIVQFSPPESAESRAGGREGHRIRRVLTGNGQFRDRESRSTGLSTLERYYKEGESLVYDAEQLLLETDFDSAEPARPRWIDRPEHQNDVELWNAVFNFCQRRSGHSGAFRAWQEIFKRKKLVNMEGPVAQSFWQSVAEAAAVDESFLESAWAYAEFVHESHDQSWPQLYSSVMLYCLENRQYARAVRWHVRLSPNFGPNRKDFFDMIKRFILDTDAGMHACLQSIYATSTHRQLYDTIVPYLWSQGHANSAKGWRLALTCRGDVPGSSMSRPFLQYLSGYFPWIPLYPEEEAVVAGRGTDPTDMEQPIARLFSTVNRVHGETFGIREKTYNDAMGAKWFATKWISIERAMDMVHTLGFQEIGPLSLQSIALRAQDCQEILQRLDQLRQREISVGSTNYVKLIQRLAAEDDFDTLRELLTSDLHPDVFQDDYYLFKQLLERSASLGDWRKYRLVYMARVILSADLMDEIANVVLRLCVQERNTTRMLLLMSDMEARNMPLSMSTWASIVKLVSEESSPTSETYSPLCVDFHVLLCRRVNSMKFPVAAAVWQDLLTTYGSHGCLDELEGVALELLKGYSSVQQSEQTAMRVHNFDLPASMRTHPDEGYQLIPRDLTMTHQKHPINLIFNRAMQQSIIEWGFRFTLERRTSESNKLRSSLAETMHRAHIARGVKLLAMLRDGGALVREEQVSSYAARCIGRMLRAPRYTKKGWHEARRAAHRYSVADLKEMFDKAWGSELLPSAEELVLRAQKVEAHVARNLGTMNKVWKQKDGVSV